MTVYIHRGKGMIILYVVCDLNQNEVYKESVKLFSYSSFFFTVETKG